MVTKADILNQAYSILDDVRISVRSEMVHAEVAKANALINLANAMSDVNVAYVRKINA